MESPHWSRLPTGTVAYVGPLLQQSYPEGLEPVERIHAGAVCE